MFFLIYFLEDLGDKSESFHGHVCFLILNNILYHSNVFVLPINTPPALTGDQSLRPATAEKRGENRVPQSDINEPIKESEAF